MKSRGKLYKAIRLLLKLIFISLLLLTLLCAHDAILSGHYYFRKWIWYSLGLSAIALAVSEKDSIAFFKKRHNISEPNFMLKSILFILIFVSGWSGYHPQINARDELLFLQTHYEQFEEVYSIKKFLFRNNPEFGTATFTNTGKNFRWETKDTSGNLLGFNQDLGDQSDLITAALQDMTDDFEMAHIVLTQNEIRFHFYGYNTPLLVRSDQKETFRQYIVGNFHIDTAREED